MRKESIKSI